MSRWVKFVRDYDERVSRGRIVAHRAGSVAFLRETVADHAISLGAAEFVKKPKGATVSKRGRVRREAPPPSDESVASDEVAAGNSVAEE